MRPGSASKRLTSLHYITGIFALALACASALCIYFYATPAHASSGNRLANASASSGQVVFDDTETETPSQTPTHTPTSTATSTSTPTATSTSMPTPLPSTTRITTPSPTSKGPTKATVLPSSTAASKQTPASVNVATGGLQTPVISSIPTNKQSNQVSQDTSASGSAFPIVPLAISLGSLILLGLLLKGWWGILRRPSPKVGAPKLPDSVSAPTNRAHQGSQQETIIAQRAFDLAVPWGGVLTKDQFAQAVQQRTVNMLSPLPPPGNVANTPPYTGTTASTSFYSYPGIRRPGGFASQSGNQPADINAIPTVPNTPVPTANQPALQAQASSGPSTDNLGLSDDPSSPAWVQTYIY
jgi:hypothetical protein